MGAGYTRLVIRDLRLTMGIGVYAHEHDAPQPVLVNITADVNPPADWQADSYENVVCYAGIAQAARDIAGAGHVRLVETFAERLAAHCLGLEGVLAVTVRVEKTAILPDAAGVGVEIRREKGPTSA